MPPRTSLTKAQQQTAAGAELIYLCQAYAQDGRLADEEIEALRQWLADHRDSDLPSLAFLTTTVEHILADGVVTPAERTALYKAIETVLPPDIRTSVRGTRIAAEAVAKEEVRQQRDAARDRNRAIDSWDFMVAGVLYEGRAAVVEAHARENDHAFLARDRANKHSRHAVEVRLANGLQIGYVPEEFAVEVAHYIDRGHKHHAYIKRILTGRRAPIPVVVATVYDPGTELEGAVSEADVPPGSPFIPGLEPNTVQPQAKKGCASMLLALLFALVAGAHAAVTPLMVSAAMSFQIVADDLVERAITAAKTSTSAQLIRPHVFEGAILIETPFLRVALQARDAFDRYLPFSASDVDRSGLGSVVIAAHGKELNFKHLVIAIPPPGILPLEADPPLPEPTMPPLTYEEAARQQKAEQEARKRGGPKVDTEVQAAYKAARAKWVQEMERREAEADRRERAAWAAATILQPTKIEATEHVWQNAYSATFKTTGIKATFPLDSIGVGRQIRAVLDDGKELKVDLTHKIVSGLR